MPFAIPALRQIGEAEATQLVRDAESLCPAGAAVNEQAAKTLLIDAALRAMLPDWHAEIVGLFTQMVEDHEMINGERAGNEAEWDLAVADGFRAELGEIMDTLGIAHFPLSQLSTDEGRGAAAQMITDKIGEHLRPDAGDEGKWLSKIGLAAKHWQPLVTPLIADKVPATAFAPTEAEQSAMAATPYIPSPDDMDDDMREMLGLPPRAAAAATDKPKGRGKHKVAGGKIISTEPPQPSDISGAYQLFAQATDVQADEMAKALGVGKSTVSNYLSGRVTNIKINTEQAKRMIAECDVRVAKLQRAAELFTQAVVPM